RESKGGLALLEEQRILPARNCGRLQTQHHASSKCSRPYAMLRHTHKPVGRKKSVRAARAGLLQVADEHVGVKHELPLTFGAHQHGCGRGVRLRGSARAAVVLDLLDERFRM